jgi:hypothetical protein
MQKVRVKNDLPWMTTHIKNLITERKNNSTTKSGRKWLTLSDIKSGNAKKVSTTASKIKIAINSGKH